LLVLKWPGITFIDINGFFAKEMLKALLSIKLTSCTFGYKYKAFCREASNAKRVTTNTQSQEREKSKKGNIFPLLHASIGIIYTSVTKYSSSRYSFLLSCYKK